MVTYRPILVLGAAALFGWVFFQKPVEKIYFPPFEKAQESPRWTPEDRIDFYQHVHSKKWRKVRRSYRSNLLGKRKRQKTTKIPKKIHQIYLGDSIPPSIAKAQSSWANLHPDWEYHLWTEEEISHLYLQNRTSYEQASSHEQKLEILRYEILQQFGGIFVENEITCLKPLDILVETVDFFAILTDAIESPCLGSKIIGSIPSHPILEACVKKWEMTQDFFTPSFFSANKGKAVALPTSFISSETKENTSAWVAFIPKED